MRASRRIFALPLVLLGLLLQIGAPIDAARMAAAMADPFAAMPVCSPDKTSAPSGRQVPADRHGDHDCCIAAAFAATGGEPVSTGASAPTLSVAQISRPQFAVQASPRGPPLRRANAARAPPVPYRLA
jgi:hypothetical protein